MSSSLITTIRTKFLDAIRSVQPPGRWKILVVDEHAKKLLGSVLKQFDILEENVTLIESISDTRDPQADFEAMYLLMPTNQNVDRVIRDFSDKDDQQYAGAHLFFMEGLPDPLLQRLAASPAEPYLRGLTDLFLNFWGLEAQSFSVEAPEMFFSIYSPPRNDNAFTAARQRLEEDIRFVSKAITNVCITLNEFPYIRYYVPPHHGPLGALKPHSSTRAPAPSESSARWRTNLARGADARAYESADGDFVTKMLAFMVQGNLEEYQKANPDFGKSDVQRLRSILVITDRSMDMMAPFLHEFTYQAMANDLLPIENGSKYTYKFQSSVGAYEDKTAILSDADYVWTGVRHMHMREAIDKLMADFNKFLTENAVFKGDAGAANLNDMKEMLANLPQYQEQREKFSLHLNMAQECMAIFENDQLPIVASVEQSCATGLNAEGRVPKSLVEEMVPLLDSKQVLNLNKVRMIALYIQFRDGVPDEDRRRLYQHARLTLAEQDAVNALLSLGVRISRSSSDRDIKKKLKQKPDDGDYELSRFKPLLKTVIEDLTANKLEDALFPYVKDSPAAPISSGGLLRAPPTSLRSQQASWHKTRGPSTEIRQRIMVFVAGGVTYAEIRETYQLSESLHKDIYIGSTHTITPKSFVDDLKSLESNGAGSKALPNGLRDPAGRRAFQEYYDEKYWTKDAPRAPKRPKAQPAPKAAAVKAPQIAQADSSSSTAAAKKPKKRGLFNF
ncbi:Sec1-like protein [Mycena floridula]|nr:Sec1-like protein [Mycena floridula]